MSNIKSIVVPLVGMHFRPPAKQVLEHLPAGAELGLRPEPENPYDAKAISVWVVPATQVPVTEHEMLSARLQGTGNELEELLEMPELQLGYIADSDGKAQRASGGPGNREAGELAVEVLGADWVRAFGKLEFAPDGKPQVRLQSDTIELGSAEPSE